MILLLLILGCGAPLPAQNTRFEPVALDFDNVKVWRAADEIPHELSSLYALKNGRLVTFEEKLHGRFVLSRDRDGWAAKASRAPGVPLPDCEIEGAALGRAGRAVYAVESCADFDSWEGIALVGGEEVHVFEHQGITLPEPHAAIRPPAEGFRYAGASCDAEDCLFLETKPPEGQTAGVYRILHLTLSSGALQVCGLPFTSGEELSSPNIEGIAIVKQDMYLVTDNKSGPAPMSDTFLIEVQGWKTTLPCSPE